MARALDELTQPPDRPPVELNKDPYGDSFFHETSAFASNDEPFLPPRAAARNQRIQERIKAEDLQARGIPTYRNASGGISPITDDTGTALTAFDTRHNIAYDSAGQPKQISYDETGPPKLSDPFAALPTRLDPKTGALEKFGPGGIYQYQGQDPVTTADLARKEKDKNIQRESTLLNRKLTLDEHDLHAGIADQKVLKAELKTAVPTLIDPKYEGADKETVMKAIDEHFNSQYAAPEANETKGWFGKDLSPEAQQRRQEVDAAKAKAYESATSLFDLNDQLSSLHETVSATRESERANVETLLAHAQGGEGPLDQVSQATPEGGTKKTQLYPPEQDWARMLGGKDAAAAVHDQIRTGNVPAPIAPAVLAATHDYEDAKKKAEAVKESNPTLYEQYSNVAASILHGLTKGVTEIVKGSYAEPGWSTIIDPLQQTGLMGSWAASLFTGETAQQYRQRARSSADAVTKETETLMDERLKDSIGTKVGNFVGGMAPYVAAAVATKGKSVATPLLASMFYTSGYQSTYEDAKAHGASDTKADLAGMGVGAINAVLALPLRTVGKAAEAIFGDTAPKVIQRAITNAFEHGGPEGAGALLGRLAEMIKGGGAGSEALRKEAVEGINSIIAEIAKPAGQRVLDVAKTAATHAALGAGVQTSENLVKKTYNPDQGTFEGVPEQALAFGALGTLSEGFRQIALARKSKQALDLIKKGGGTPPAEPPALGPGETRPTEPTPPGPKPSGGGETRPTEKPAKVREITPSEPAAPAKAESAVRETSPTATATASRNKIEPGDAIAEGDQKFVVSRVKTVGTGETTVHMRPEGSPKATEIEMPLEVAQKRIANNELIHTKAAPSNVVDVEAHKAATSPTNGLAEPSQAQKEAGNYQKGHVQVAGLDISIENPAGSKRKPEYRALESHYGYIKGTVGADKDHVDIFVKKETPADWSGPVFVINQVNAKGKFDEHKAVIGVKNQSEALKEYNANYQPGWKGAHSVVKFENAADFKTWAESGATGEPASQTAVRIRTPEGGKMHKPQIEEPHIVSTALKHGEQYLVGSKWNEPHEGIGMRHGIEKVKPSDRGFIVQDADGGQRFVSRKEAGPIAQKAGQNMGPISAEGVQSAELKPAVTRAENKVTNLAKGTMAKHRSTLAALGHDVAPRIGKTDSESGIQAKLNRQGVPMITLDPKKLAKATEGMDDRAKSKYVQRAVEEEILHVGALRWELQSPENNAAIKDWGAERDELDKHLAGSYPGWEDLSERQKGHEKLRAVLQKRWTGKLTEAATRVLKAFLKYLRGIYEKLTPGQREIVDGVESILGNKAEMKPPANVTPQAPTGETKYVLPSFVTAPHVKAKPTKLDLRAESLEARLNDTTNKAPYIAASTDAAVIRTLLRSRTGVALDQAEKKIGKLEEKHASKEPSTKTVGVRSEGGGLGEGAPLRQPGETPSPSKEKPAGRAGSSTLDAQTQKELSDAFEGLFAGLPKNLTDKIGGAQISEGDVEELRKHNLLRLGAAPEKAVKLGGSKEVGDEASAKVIRQMRESLGAGVPQLAIPAEKIGPFVTVAGKLVAQGVDTPQKLAAELETLFKGKARPFSQALWDAIGMVRPELRGTHDWTAIYLTSTPGTAAPAIVLPQNRDQLVRQVSLSLQTGPVTRRQLTEMAKESGLDVKRVDEAAETGIVMAARDMAEPITTDTSPLTIFDQMVELYDRQPNLTAKTSTSKVEQAYSTPVPLAYAASRLADIRNGKTIYEPTAGNGVLLMEADPKSQEVVANEINAHRLQSLSDQGFKPQANDATKWSPGGKAAPREFDRVIANPPFGTVLDANGEKKTWELWDKATDQIDHAIAAKALEAMKDDGRAVLILGGKNMKDPDERAKAYIGSENQRNFWPELYRRYNVVDHFTIDGDLYSKQGAGWPVDVVIIAGRGASRIQLPSAEAPRILTSWGELRNELSRSDDERIEAGRYSAERDSAKVGGLVDSIRGVAESESGIGPKGDTKRALAPDGGGGRPESVAPTVRSEPEPPARREPEPSDVAPARGAGELGTGTTDVQPLERGQQLAFRVPYKSASKLDSFGIFIPTNMEAPAREALARLQERIGPIDEYVRTKLGYPEGAPLGNYFSAEQMDALALGIDAIDGQTAFVLGDQGGVGKGRVAAGMIAYSKQQGKVPIFITKDEKLYAAMIEDLHDIGQDHVVPVFTNNGIEFEDYSGTKWKQGSMTQVMKELARTGKLPMHADVLFTTYSQIQTDVPAGYKASKAERANLKSTHKAPPDGVRMEALKKLAPGSVIIADESHLAAGDSIRAWRLSPLLYQAHGVYYSSATFAKRPDSMGIYSRTSLSHATQSMGDLVDAMKQGGVPLQQVVSATLASDGLYLRRERDFSKAVFRTQINLDTRERDARLADNYTEGLRAILNISNKMKSATDFLNKILRREAKQMHVEHAPRVESTNFSSKLHNLVSQYLFAIKAEAMVRRAVEGVTVGFPNKAGDVLKHKVIIAVQNTMEQPILALERSAHALNFKGMLLQYLDSQRTLVSGRGQSAQVTRISDKPDPNFERYSDKDLQRLIIVPNPKNPEETGVNEPALNELFRRIMAGAFKDAETLIESLDLADMPLSPIDHIRQKLSLAGIKNAEITKRGTGIDEDGTIYKVDPSSNTKAAHLRYMSDFNNGDTDVMVINASGSTGISLHSSKKFKRTDPRAMIIGQPHLDINEFMQTLYRTDRTGQVHQPYYELLQTAIPAELRPAAILNRKMGSLNANTTSNAENEISAGNVGVDIFNQYGDEVVYNYLKSDRVFTDMLDMPKIMTESGLGTIDDVLGLYEEDGQFAAAVTGRVAVLPTSEQEEFWTKVSADYVAKINYLNELGENELQAEAIDMKAETLDRKELTPAVVGKGRASGFDQPSYLERIKADIGMKPLPGTEVVTMMEELGARAYELRNDWITRAEAWKKTELERLSQKVLSWDSEKRMHYEARWREQEEEINAAIGLIGDGLHLKTEKGLDGYGAITDVKFDEEHPLTPSKQIFTVHVNTTKKVLRVAASQLPSIARQAVGDFADLYEATAERSNERYMITGNLLSAYLAIRDAAPSAKIVQYTTDQGELRQGILMPQKFAPGALSKKRVVDSASHMRALLDAGRALTNGDGSVTIVKPSGPDYVMRVPSSRTMGGAYWRDSQLAGLMHGGEFVERSGAMIGKFGTDGLPKVYQRLLDLNATMFFNEQDEALGAGKPHKAPAAFYKDDVEPIARSIGMSVKESFDMLKHLVSPTSGVAMDAHDRVMKMLGERNQKAYETDRVLDAWGKALDKMPRPQLIAFVDNMKLGKPQATPELQELAQTMRKIDTDSWDAAVAAYSALGFKDKEIPLQWLENHYRVLWKKIPGDTAEEKGAWIGKTRRGLRGSMGQHKQHTLETMSDGLAMGGVPYSYNPVEMFKLAQADLWKLTTTLRVWKWGKDNHFVEYVKGPFPKAPDGMVPLDDPIARVYFPSESGEGLVNAGQYFVEEGFGRLLNNYLSKDYIRQTKLGRGLLWLKNATTSLELSLSPFHAVFETLEMVGSDIGLGLGKLINRGLMKGDLGAAASGIKDILAAPASPFTGWHLGREIRKAAGDPETYFKTAAGKKMLKSYPRAREFIDDLFTAGWKPNELEQDWKNESVRAFVESVADLKAGKSDNYVGAGLRAFPAANEMLMKPLFDWYIPSLKVAQFFKEYAEAIEQNERKLKGGILTRAALARQVWRFVEDRFGEMNFDSLFWNRNFKTAMQLMFRSVTWKLGSVHAFGGAFAGQGKEFKDAFRERRAPELHRNMAWLFGMFLLTATLGAIISKVLGKKDPKNLTDFVFPQIDPKDDKIRVSLPTYFKDMVHLIHSPTSYVTSSMSGWIGRVADLLRNKDYYGVQIRDSDDSIVKQALQVAEYTGQTLLPFSVRGYKQMSDQDVTGLRKALAFVAVNPAPRHVSQTPAEKRSEEYWKGHQTEEGISPEQFESKREKRRIVGQLRHGDAPNLSAALAVGTIKPADIKPLYQRAAMGPLSSQVLHMPLADAEKVYQRANLKERAELAGIMEKKRANSAKRGRKMFTGF
jgi:tRNA G10  N-methylase Trm11